MENLWEVAELMVQTELQQPTKMTGVEQLRGLMKPMELEDGLTEARKWKNWELMEGRQLVEQNMVKEGQLRNMRVGTFRLPWNAPANVRILKTSKARPEASGQGI